MCSRLFKAVFIYFVALSFVSCSYFFGDKEDPEAKTYDLSITEKAGLDCVNENSDLLKDYFNMKRPDEKIRRELISMKTCLRDAVKLFVTHVDGSQINGGYNASEVHRFLQQTFKQYDFDSSMLEQAFILKDSLIGGGSAIASKEDVNKLLIYIDFIYDKLALHATDRHSIFRRDRGGDLKAFGRAEVAFNQTLKDFAKLPFKKSGTFDYLSLTKLITQFLDEDDAEDWKHWMEAFEIANSLQALLGNGKRDIADIQKLPFLIENLGGLYLSYIQFETLLKDNGEFYNDISTVLTFPGLLNALIKHPKVFEDEKLEITHQIQLRLLKALRNGVQAAPNGEISTSYVNDLIDTFDKLKMLPSYARGPTLKNLVPQFFGRWLSSEQCIETEALTMRSTPRQAPKGKPCEAGIVTVSNIDLLINIAKDWKERQVWINSLSPRRDSTQISLHEQGTKRSSANLQSFQDTLKRLNHLHWEDYVVIGSKDLNYKDMVVLNSIYTLVVIFTRPFNENWKNPKYLDYYLTQGQTEQLFKWMQEMGIELKIIDPRTVGSGLTAFSEINLFGSTSYEPTQLNFTEMLEYLEISISTGLRSVYWMENEFKLCRITGLLDVFDLTKLDANCFRPLFKKDVERLLYSSLPRLVEYLKNDPKAAPVETMLAYLEKASRQGLIVDVPMETDSFRMMSSISQYAEALFIRFDTNNDNIIDKLEVKNVLAHIGPSVKRIITDTLSKERADQVYRIFPEFETNIVTYILNNKKLPGLLTAQPGPGEWISVADLAIFRTWNDTDMPTWLKSDVEVRREDILQVVSGLSLFTRLQRIQTMKDIFYEEELNFNDGISDINSTIFSQLMEKLQCSSKIAPQVRQWLFDNQKNYWIKDKVDNWNVLYVDIPWTEGLTNWPETITFQLVNLIYAEPTIGHLCTLPYSETAHRVRKEQEVEVREMKCVTRRQCSMKTRYLVY